MKIRSVFSLLFLAYSSICADFHEPALNLTFDHFSDLKFTANLNHQSSIMITDQDVLALYVYSSVDKSAKFHHELGIGYRKHFENFGVGMNVVSNHFNRLEGFNHQFVPGFEIFFGDFQISYNRYIPLRSVIKKKLNPNLEMYDVSEISVMYRLSNGYEFGVAPYINHQTHNIGATGHFGVYFAKNWKISVNPYYHQAEKGVAVSFGFDFGGPKTRMNAPIQKSHRFFYSVAVTPSDSENARASSSHKKEEPVASESQVKSPADHFAEAVKKPGGEVIVRVR